MSRIGKKPIPIPQGVAVEVSSQNQVTVKGPKGKLDQGFRHEVTVEVDGEKVVVHRVQDTARHRAQHGLARALIANMVTGVSEGFLKTLELHGVGYNAQVKDGKLVLKIGFCHEVEYPIPAGLEVEVQRGKPIIMRIRGCDKQAVGQFAAIVRDTRPPDPYKQKGIRYKGEVIRTKAGKAFGSEKK